ncbi:dockerin type I domain-containing protein [Lacipirellula limnantheis]|uniref:PEP-CTERM protein-sorting domain-containing protein n=1 Tax=Lacipirellula limnantheis TaxID=2528024 RepID=A0A517U3J5_9BACT|nr:dockerin type I domain-containing protein [Lacipirellula limnantheis]QDT75183.1 hypothetical protein I41_43920 [Lacipirellula limnantheis]
MAARFGLALTLTMLSAMTASAQTVLLNDDFDGYADQAALNVNWTPVGTQPSGTLSSVQSSSPSNSFLVAAENDSNQVPAGANANAQRNERFFEETLQPSTENKIQFSIDFYDAFGTGNPFRQYANLQDGPGTAGNQLIALGLNNNQLSGDSGGNYYMARIVGFAPSDTNANPTGIDPDGGPNERGGLASGQFFKLNDFGVGLRSVGWHNLKVIISSDDDLSTDYEFYVDNVLAERVSNVGTDATRRSYEVVRLGAGLTNNGKEAYYDNVNVTLNPVIVTPPANNADFNGDNVVDGADFLIWQRGFGLTGQPNKSTGDANGDGNVDGADLDLWKTKFGGAPAIAAVGSIPEPTSMAMAAAALVAGCAVARRRG